VRKFSVGFARLIPDRRHSNGQAGRSSPKIPETIAEAHRKGRANTKRGLVPLPQRHQELGGPRGLPLLALAVAVGGFTAQSRCPTGPGEASFGPSRARFMLRALAGKRLQGEISYPVSGGEKLRQAFRPGTEPSAGGQANRPL